MLAHPRLERGHEVSYVKGRIAEGLGQEWRHHVPSLSRWQALFDRILINHWWGVKFQLASRKGRMGNRRRKSPPKHRKLGWGTRRQWTTFMISRIVLRRPCVGRATSTNAGAHLLTAPP